MGILAGAYVEFELGMMETMSSNRLKVRAESAILAEVQGVVLPEVEALVAQT